MAFGHVQMYAWKHIAIQTHTLCKIAAFAATKQN